MIKRAEELVLQFAGMLLTGIRGSRGDATAADSDADRGDVPGWVMITLMTAIVVIGLLTIFRTEVFAAVSNAFRSVN